MRSASEYILTNRKNIVTNCKYVLTNCNPWMALNLSALQIADNIVRSQTENFWHFI